MTSTTKHTIYMRNATQLIAMIVGYSLIIKILHNDMGIRWIGKCWGYTLMLTRIGLFVEAFIIIGSLFCKVIKESFELYDEESGFYGVLAGH